MSTFPVANRLSNLAFPFIKIIKVSTFIHLNGVRVLIDSINVEILKHLQFYICKELPQILGNDAPMGGQLCLYLAAVGVVISFLPANPVGKTTNGNTLKTITL